MKTLLAGPWVGEFGWELFCWQGFVRNQSKKFDRTIVASREGSRDLYSDFCDKFIAIETSNMEVDAIFCRGADPINLNVEADEYLSPKQIKFEMYNHVPVVWDQEFILFGDEDKDLQATPTIVIHARSTSKVGTSDRNWEKEKWQKLVSKFPEYRIVSIGTKDAALLVEGTEDYRSKPLKEVFNLLRNSLVVVGPSSGPMHLGSLCGTTQVVFSGHSRNYKRYKKLWNPFKTKVNYIDTWNPEVDLVEDSIRSCL